MEEPLVVLVDADAASEQIVKTITVTMGFALRTIVSGHDYLEKIQALRPTLILLNTQESENSGLNLCLEIHSNPLTADIPILYFTTSASSVKIDQIVDSGAADFLSIPFKIEELTARIRNQVALQVSKRRLESEILTKQKLFSLISHDLRSPFTSMIGVMQLLISDYDSMTDHDRKEFLQALLDNSLQQLTLLDNLMYWSRGQSDRVTVNLHAIPLAALVKTVTDSLQGMAAEKAVELHFDIPPTLQVMADTELTRVILKNLIHNGIKYSEPKGRIQIYTPLELNKTGMVNILIEDTGKGMTEQQQLLSASRFVSTPGTAGEKGAGIGLAIAVALAKKQNGFLRVVKSDQSGTVLGLGLQRVVE